MIAKLSELQAAFDLVDLAPAGILETTQAVCLTSTEDSKLELLISGVITSEARVFVSEGGTLWEAILDRKFLGAFLSTAKSNKVTITHKPDKLELVCGAQRSNLALLKMKEGAYRAWSGKGAYIKLPDWLRSDFKLLATYAATSAGSEHLAAVSLLEHYGALASDSLSVCGMLSRDVPATVLVPVSLAGIAGRIDEFTMVEGKTGVALKTKLGYVHEKPNGRLDKYPNSKLRELLDTAAKAKDKGITFAADKLSEDLSLIGKLSTAGNRAVVRVVCDGGSKATLTVQQDKTVVQRSTKVTEAGKFEALWPIGKVAPFILSAGDNTVTCGRYQYMTYFRYKLGKLGRTYVLVVVDVG